MILKVLVSQRATSKNSCELPALKAHGGLFALDDLKHEIARPGMGNTVLRAHLGLYRPAARRDRRQ
jgi:hypothetical protein